MSLQEPGETSSLFSVNGIKERMKEKKHGVLKTAKLNVSLASKIRAKTINNSSIIKITLKQNNKALALALSAAKIAAQRLTDDKMILQKEVELCHFENACLRQKLSSVNKCVGELQQLMNRHLQAAFKLSRFSENASSSLLLNDEGHHWTDSIAGNQDSVNCLSQAAPKSLRIPLSHVDDDDNEQDRGLGMATVPSLPMLPSGVAAFGLGEPWDSVPPAAAEKSFSSCHKESLASNGNNVQILSEEDGTALALDLSTVFADNLLPSALQNSRSCSLSALSRGSPMQQDKDISMPWSDSVVLQHEHVTKRKKRRTGLSDTSGGSSCHVEPSDNVLLDDLQGPTEMEPTAKEKLEVSQVGELLTLSSKNKNYRKIKANEAKALKKVSAGTKDNQQKRNVDSYNNALRPPETDRLNNSKIKTPKSEWFAEDSRQTDPLEETVALDGCSRKEEHSSKHFDEITVCRRSSVVDPSHVNDCNPLRTFLEKKKNIEIHFQNPETTALCNQIQQDEKSSGHRGKRLSWYSNKTRGSRRTYVVDPGSPQHKNDCSPSAHETKRNKHLEDLEELNSLFPNSRSSLLNSKAPLRAFSPQQLTDIQKEIPNQETTLGLNVKRIKPKRKTQELDMVHKLGETEGECFDVNMHSHTQPEESKVKKGHKSKAAKTGKGNREREHCRTSVELFEPMENASRVKKRKNNLRVSTTSLSQTKAITLESMTPAPPVSMDGDDDPFDDIVRNSTKKPQKVQRSSGIQSTIYLNKTNSSSSQNIYLGVSSQATDVKKRVDTKSKLNKRTTYTVKNLAEVCVASNSLPSPEEGKTSQEDQLGWNFLRVPASRTQQEVLTMNVIEAPSQFDSVATDPSTPRSSPVDSTETILPDSCPSGHSSSVLGDAKTNSNPGRNSTLSPTSATFNKNYAKRVVSGRGQKKTVLATPEMALQDPASQENENNVLKDVTNANPHSYSSVSPEASPVLPSRRRNKGVSYAEPKLNSKLRRGDPYTVTDFLRSPIYKTKRKKMSKTSEKSRKSKKVKQEEIQPTIDFIAVS